MDPEATPDRRTGARRRRATPAAVPAPEQAYYEPLQSFRGAGVLMVAFYHSQAVLGSELPLLDTAINPVAWSLAVEMLAVPVILFLYAVARRYGSRWLLVALVAAVALSFAPGLAGHRPFGRNLFAVVLGMRSRSGACRAACSVDGRTGRRCSKPQPHGWQPLAAVVAAWAVTTAIGPGRLAVVGRGRAARYRARSGGDAGLAEPAPGRPVSRRRRRPAGRSIRAGGRSIPASPSI